MREVHYFLYHNPDSMGSEFQDIAQSGCIATDKEAAAENAARDNAIIWCVGKRGKGPKARYFLYQRITDGRCYYTKPSEIAEGAFKISLCGKPTFPKGYEWDITDEDFFSEIRSTRILTMGLQSIGIKNSRMLAAFKSAFANTII